MKTILIESSFETMKKNEKLLQKNIMVMRKETFEKAQKRRATVCAKCTYRGSGNTCDYILRENKIRPCAAKDCVKKGIFVKKSAGSTGQKQNYFF